jgi:hypothetical protein
MYVDVSKDLHLKYEVLPHAELRNHIEVRQAAICVHCTTLCSALYEGAHCFALARFVGIHLITCAKTRAFSCWLLLSHNVTRNLFRLSSARLFPRVLSRTSGGHSHG